MELRIEKIQFPEVINFNFEELKQEISNRAAMYSNMVYTEDQVKQAKADRANLRKFVDALSAERIKVKKQCLQPYEAFEAKVNELAKIVQEPIALIDEQVKDYEEKQKQEKLAKIQEYWNSIEKPELHWLGLPAIYNEKWLNASVSMKSIQEEITSKLEQIESDLSTLSNLPEFGFEAVEVYKTTLDMNRAISEAKRMSEIAKAKAEREAEQARLAAEAEAKKQEEVVCTHTESEVAQSFVEDVEPVKEQLPPAKQLVKFAAYLSVEDAEALKAFFLSRQIEFRAI